MRFNMITGNNSSENDSHDKEIASHSQNGTSISRNGGLNSGEGLLNGDRDLFVEDLLSELDKVVLDDVIEDTKIQKHSLQVTQSIKEDGNYDLTSNIVQTDTSATNTQNTQIPNHAPSTHQALSYHTLSSLENENLNLKEQLAILQNNHASEMKELQTRLEEQDREGEGMKERLMQQLNKLKSDSYQKQQLQLQTIQTLEKQVTSLRQERDEGVMRFAEAERKKEEMRVSMEKGEVMMRGWGREREAALNRWRVVCDENKRAFRVCESQKQEVADLKKEVERLTEAANNHEHSNKASNNKLKVEQDNHKETSKRLMECVKVVNEVRAEAVNIHDVINNIFQTLQELNDRPPSSLSPTSTATTTTTAAAATTTTATKPDWNNVVKVMQSTRKDLHQLLWKQKEIVSEMLTYKDKIHCLEMEHQARTDELSELREASVRHEEVTSLQRQLAEMTDRMAELEQHKLESDCEVSAMRQRCEESLSCNHKLTHLNCCLQTSTHALEKQVSDLSDKSSALESLVNSLQAQLTTLTEEKNRVVSDKDTQLSDLRLQLKQATDKISKMEESGKEMGDEVKVLKRRYLSAIKDLRKQLSGKDGHDSTSLYSSLSHAESSLSLDNLSTNHTPPNSSSCHACAHEQQPSDESKATIETLQKELHRKNHSVDFLNDHVTRLTHELHLKTRQVRSMEARKEFSALLADSAELHKHLSRGPAEVGKMFKVMMEDILNKNIQLKESVDTLGQEIDRLTKNNKLLQSKLDESRGILVEIPDTETTMSTTTLEEVLNTGVTACHQDATSSIDVTQQTDMNNNDNTTQDVNNNNHGSNNDNTSGDSELHKDDATY